jgi:polar amino acid transport system permease protein
MKKFRKSQNDGGLNDPFAVSPVRRPSIIVAAVVVGFLVVIVVRELIVNPNFRFDVVGEYLFDSDVLMVVVWTFILTIS